MAQHAPDLDPATSPGTPPGFAEAIDAARAGDAARLTTWLAAGNDPNRHDGEGWTPLLWAAVRGHHEAVAALVAGGADVTLAHARSAGRPIHMAGHSGSVAVADILLRRDPKQLDAVWDINGHTVLLQAVFYGHLELARFLAEKGADTTITTARGLGPYELADQFQNDAMKDVIRPYDSAPEEKAAYYRAYLARIAPTIPKGEEAAQDLADRLSAAITDGLARVREDPGAVDETLTAVRKLVEDEGADVNRLGGPLQQPALIVAVTGNNGEPANPDMARLRLEVSRYLLDKGADPARREEHPMAVQAIIRAAVFNHLDILRLCGEHMGREALAACINEVPMVNGLTAMHDTVLRASMAGPDRIDGYLAQARWFVDNGGRIDMEDFAGRTQRALAEATPVPEARRRLLEAIRA